MSANQVVAFKTDKYIFGIDISKVEFIVKVPEVYKIPNIVNCIEGLINENDKIYTIMNLRKRLGLNHADLTEDSRIVILNSQKSPVGLLVDDAKDIIEADGEKTNIQDIESEDFNKEYISHILTKGEDNIYVLDTDKLFIF